jgi:antirestriction protein
MKRRVKDFVDIADHVSLDDLIEKLAEVRASLPKGSEAELRLRGDEVFGHRITISYFREQTKEEAEIEKRYADEMREAKERELERLQAELGVVCYAAPGKRGKLRIVA